jgi:D-psicose/D-tagatose/L-ribulose 3-epimerase
MKIGINTWVWVAPLRTADLDWLIPHIHDLGFDWVEIPIEEPGAISYAHARELINANGLGVSACAVIGAERDLLHPDPVVRNNGASYIRASIDAARELGAHILCGPLYSAVGRVWKQTQSEREHDLELLAGELRELADYAAANEVVLALEPINRFETSFANMTSQTLEIVERVQHPACQVMVDTFHMNIEERSLGSAIRQAGKHLVHVHTCENDRGAPGSGHIPWEEVATALKEIQYDGACVIESFTSQVDSIARAAAIWRPLATSQDELAASGVRFLKALLR